MKEGKKQLNQAKEEFRKLDTRTYQTLRKK